jgi:hypothetical protein
MRRDSEQEVVVTKGLGFICVAVVVASWNGYAQTPSGGEGFLYLGDSGYAYLENASVTDLDYSLSFSVEVVARIEPHQPGGRYATFIQKGPDLVPRATACAGFGLGTYEGDSREFAKSISAKVGDGVRQVVIDSPKAYEGYVHIVMTWDANAKTMALYINGQWIASKSDSLLSPGGIKNDGELRLGRASYELRRNLFLARLWNRELSAGEVTLIWNTFRESKRHSLPETFDRAGLLSEWLMDRMCDLSESPGGPRLHDNAGSNHLRLAGKARLVSAEGPLTAVYPPGGATNVDKSVILRVTGGGTDLGGSFTPPLHYWFEIDESPTFRATVPCRSGWIAHYAQWKPVLKPDTLYYWRFRVRDSGLPPKESSFSGTRRFRTRGPSSWYVRPLVDRDAAVDDLGNPLADAGVYGRQDGTSYADAFNGIAHIKWGEGGVEAGDTLYICDTHVYEAQHDYWVPPVVGYVEESGFSPEHPITIAMDFPQAPGMLYGFFRDTQVEVKWDGPDEQGVYRTSDLRQGAAVEASGGGYRWLERMNDVTWEGHWAAAYDVPRPNEPWVVATSYVKMSDGGSPAGRVYSQDAGYKLHLGRSRYLTFRKCNLFNSRIAADANEDSTSELAPSRGIVFENCNLGYTLGTLLDLSDGMDNWTLRGCELHDVGKAIHASDVFNLLVEQCAIHDVGAPNFPDDDAHAIGIQGGANHVIQHNHIWRTAGSSIEFWSSRNAMQDMTVRYNFIHDTLGLAQTSASGIVISGGEFVAPGKRTGFRIYGNIITNTAGNEEPWRGFGISSNNMDAVEIYNNVLYKTYHGIRLVTTTPEPGYPVKARVYNNMIVEPKGWYAFVHGNAEPWTELYWDYNLYYPATDAAAQFSFGQDVTRDSHSIFGNPKFVAGDPVQTAGFQLCPDSPAIDAGVDVGLVEDYAGWPVPRGAAPDVGAFEYP